MPSDCLDATVTIWRMSFHQRAGVFPSSKWACESVSKMSKVRGLLSFLIRFSGEG